MKADNSRLTRLRRIEKVRAVAKQLALLDAAAAEGTLAKLQTLAERTRQMACEYNAAAYATDGNALLQLQRFVGGLSDISTTALGDAGRAKSIADARLRELAKCEQRRSAAQERAETMLRELIKASASAGN